MRELVVCCVLVACGGSRQTMAPGQTFQDRGTLLVELAESPSGGATFDFCAAPEPGEPHLGNAAWLAFLSANEYAHLFYLSTMLGQLGFKNPDSGGLDWPTCATDLRVMRGFEDSHREPLVAASHAKAVRSYLEPHAERWGSCARAWFASYDGAQFPAPAFEKHLIQTVHPNAYVQFFSGGAFTHDGRVFAQGSTQVLFARHQTLPVAIIAFRGTEPTKWNDIATDLKAWKTPLAKHGWPEGWGKVHAGFLTAYESIGPVLRAKLDEYKDQDLTIWVTGHSLGGGLATVMGAEILRRIDAGERFKLGGVYTFGAPRVGDRPFRDRVNALAATHGAQMVRFRNGNDLVTSIPRVAEYEHTGKLAHLRENTIDVSDLDIAYSGTGSVADHDIAGWGPKKKAVSGYYRRLHALLASRPQRCPN